MAAIPLKVDSGKLRAVLDYLPCDACLQEPSADQEVLCSVCRRLHREVAVKLVERRHVILETPAPPPPPPVEEIPPPVPVPEASAEEPLEVPAAPEPEDDPLPEAPLEAAAEALIAEDEAPHPEAEAMDAAAEPEPARMEAESALAPEPGTEEEDDEDPFVSGFSLAGAEADEEDVGFGLAEAPSTLGEDSREAPLAELDPELLALVEEEPSFPPPTKEEVVDDEFTFTPPAPRAEPAAEASDWADLEAEAVEIEEEEWLLEETGADPVPEEVAEAEDPLLEDPGEGEAPAEVPEPGSTWDVEGLTREAAPSETAGTEEDVVEMELIEDDEPEPEPAAELAEADEGDDVLEMEVLDDEEAPAETAGVDLSLRDLEGMEVGHVERLEDAGVRDVAGLAGRDAWGLAELTGVSGLLLECWILVADLARLGVPSDYAHALSRAGVKSVATFATENPEALAEAANGFLASTKPEVSPLTAGEIREWQARTA